MNLNGTYYLNNSGSRWVVFQNGRREQITLHTASGKEVTRRVIFYESFGNFASACISYKGEKIKVLTDSTLED